MHRILSLHTLTPSYEVIPAKVLRGPVKINCKDTGSHLPVFTINSTGCFFAVYSRFIHISRSKMDLFKIRQKYGKTVRCPNN